MNNLIYIYVTPFFPCQGRHYGSYSYEFVQALKRNSSFDVRVFVPGQGNDYDFEGCHVYRFPVKILPSAVFPLLFARCNVKSFIEAVERAGIRMDDVVVCHGNTTTCAIYPLAVKRHNSRCLTLLHHHSLDGFGLRIGMFRHVWIHKAINFFIVRRLFEMMDCHVFISEASKRSTMLFPDTSWSCYKDYRRIGRGLGLFRPARIKKSIILWNGVDGRKFNKSSSKQLTRNEGGFRVGCVGNFIEVKDHLSLIKAIRMLVGKIPGLTLEILGVSGIGSFYEDAKRYIEGNGLSDVVKIYENVSHEEMANWYRRWDLMVLPSFFEGLGCVYLESWSCGTPFIACKGQGIEDVLPQCGRESWLCNPHDEFDIADKINKYYVHRPSLKLKGSISIDDLVADFLTNLKKLQGCQGT